MILTTVLAPVLYTMFLWWFTTGMIMAVYNRSRGVMQAFFIMYTILAFVAFVGLLVTRDHLDAIGAYIAITCGILVWGWHVTGYYLGFITGPRHTHEALEKMENTQRLSLKKRFMLALFAGLHHEILAIVTGIAIAFVTAGHPNRWSLWIYVALWLMHGSSRLNVLLGVRNFSVELLPERLQYLQYVVSERKYNEFFPFSMVIASVAVLVLIYQAISPDASLSHTTGSVMVITMLILGILEHGLLILPLSTILWGWGLNSVDVVPVDEHTFNASKRYQTGE